ncbi:MAG: FliI/YscN family ATPase [Planctomycetes bacterium]|nr:FliI/YscN family ATPase [Planctomycetota bacterium]
MEALETHREILRRVEPIGVSGRVSAVRGLTVSVSDFPAPVGASCRIVSGPEALEARVIGFAGEETLVMPLGSTTGVRRRDLVEFTSSQQTIAVGPDMLGRIVNAFAEPIDGRGDFRAAGRMPIWPAPIPAMRREAVSELLPVGVRAIDAMMTIAQGQRMSILSGSGVGKSVLLGMIGRFTSADVTVIAMIGERGCEVRDLVRRRFARDALERTVVIVSTSDEPPLVQVQAGATATTVAEYFRKQGADVLLLMDSLTRLATAQRQVGLAAGEPPTARGFTPSVFALLPKLLERCGAVSDGSITGFYTVLVDGDDLADPIADAARSVTDGHIWLSRDLANRGQYPAVDVLQSVSRAMIEVADREHYAAAAEIQRLVAVYNDIEELVHLGAYQRGASGEYDLAIQAMPLIRTFLAQPIDRKAEFADTRAGLIELHGRIEQMKEQLNSAPLSARAGAKAGGR